jgi:diguanylate cyclase (GGDEF)-like protein
MLRYAFFIVACSVALIWVSIGALTDHSVRRAVVQDAEDKALHWGEYVVAQVPDLPGLVETGLPTDAQKQAIRTTRQIGDIFRFKLYDIAGRLVLLSDEGFITAPQGISPDSDPEAVSVLQSQSTLVRVEDGRANPDRPALYAEAYIPLFDAAGQAVGVAEVYVDETRVAAYFLESFEDFAIWLTAVCAAFFSISAIAYTAQRNRTQESRKNAEYYFKYDAVTGLLNRAAFHRQVANEGENGAIAALMFVDADNFKIVNDTHGHAAGDEYLAHIARILGHAVSPSDVVGRFGGDEFVVAVRSGTEESVTRTARAVLQESAKPFLIDGREIKSSVSIGISILEPDTPLETALAHADAALYYAKHAGRNQYAVYGENMREQLQSRNRLDERIRRAARDKDFTISYQPLVAWMDGTHRQIGYEALLRLVDDEGNAISPTMFIPRMEEMGLIEDVGSWVIREATRDVAHCPGAPKVSINLSAVQFQSGRLPGIVAEALSASGLPPERLELEVTETLLLDDDPSIGLQMDALQETGVGIAMDDFGTGYSSLGYLWRYGFDRIKIDRSFVAGLEQRNERSIQIIEAIVILGKRLGMEVTAEGVETEQQAKILTELGCDILQGYLFGRPGALQATARPKSQAGLQTR